MRYFIQLITALIAEVGRRFILHGGMDTKLWKHNTSGAYSTKSGTNFFYCFCFQERIRFLIFFGRVTRLQKMMSSFDYYFMVVSALRVSMLAKELLGGKMLNIIPFYFILF
ncbi:hypothetical protein NC652_007933 [Populus alba x Populus x berolinensis]|nr:hypothetical protein NC652_007933 [Populus alba x Populus x berolinensis]